MAGTILKTGKFITKTAEKIVINATNGNIDFSAITGIVQSSNKEIVHGSYKQIEGNENEVLFVRKVEGPTEVKVGKSFLFKATSFSRKATIKELENVKWAYKIDNQEIQYFPNPGRVIGGVVTKHIEMEQDLWDNTTITVYAYVTKINEDVFTKCHITGVGKAILIAFPEQSADIPMNQNVYRWFEEKFGDNDGQVNDAGHAGIIIIAEKKYKKYKKGHTKYFDFGRYDERINELGKRDSTNQGIVRSSNHISSFGIPNWDFNRTNIENARILMKKLLSSGKFKGYGKMIGAIAYNLDFGKMIEYALYIENKGIVPFGGHLKSAHRDNATYCAKFARGVAESGGMDWDFNTLRGTANINDIIETYKGDIIEIENK
ncbi:MAG: hypothetical protein JKY08_06225 [Flavobacteriaceae bacterium]|nr:hypothetical protein [Flavobacteriaceae bacterium]